MTRQQPTYTVDKMAEFVVRADQSDLQRAGAADVEAERSRQHRLRARRAGRRTHPGHPRPRRAVQQPPDGDVHRRWACVSRSGGLLQCGAGALSRSTRHLSDSRRSVSPGRQLRCRFRRRRTRRSARSRFPAGSGRRLRDPIPFQRTGSRYGPRPQPRTATGHVGGRRLGQVTWSRRRGHRRRHRRLRRGQRVARRGARGARLDLERHLAGHHRDARGVHHHAREPWNHRSASTFRGSQRPRAVVRPADRHAHIRPVADRRRTDLPQAVLLTDSRSGHHRRDVGASRRVQHHRRRRCDGDARGLSGRVRHRRRWRVTATRTTRRPRSRRTTT